MYTKSIPNGTVHRVPQDFRATLLKNAKSLATWDDITPLARNEWLCWITSAKHDETRARRIRIAKANLAAGKRRPCCWAGCPHR